MDVSKLSFEFKGGRDYIHGTDMFNQLTSFFPGKKIRNIRFSVHHQVKNANCLLYVSEDKNDLSGIKELAASCQIDVDGVKHWMGLAPEKDTSSEARYAYDEEIVVNNCRLDEESVILTGESPYTFIETTVAMNKHLLTTLFPGPEHQWLFTRIDLPAPCTTTTGLSLVFKHNMSFRLFKSEIFVTNEKVGELFFSLVK